MQTLSLATNYTTLAIITQTCAAVWLNPVVRVGGKLNLLKCGECFQRNPPFPNSLPHKWLQSTTGQNWLIDILGSLPSPSPKCNLCHLAVCLSVWLPVANSWHSDRRWKQTFNGVLVYKHPFKRSPSPTHYTNGPFFFFCWSSYRALVCCRRVHPSCTVINYLHYELSPRYLKLIFISSLASSRADFSLSSEHHRITSFASSCLKVVQIFTPSKL